MQLINNNQKQIIWTCVYVRLPFGSTLSIENHLILFTLSAIEMNLIASPKAIENECELIFQFVI